MKIKVLILTVLVMGLVSSCSKETPLEFKANSTTPHYSEEELPTDPPPTEEDDEEGDNGNPFTIG